jgi:diphthamide biosynthesis protein 3
MSFYDEIEIEDMTYDEATTLYHYPCPCGDRFEISLGDLRDGEDVAVCPSCSLQIKVIFEAVSKSPVDISVVENADLRVQEDLPRDEDGAAPPAPVAVAA